MNHNTAKCTGCNAIVTLPHAKARGVQCDVCYRRVNARVEEAAKAKPSRLWQQTMKRIGNNACAGQGHGDQWRDVFVGAVRASTFSLGDRIDCDDGTTGTITHVDDTRGVIRYAVNQTRAAEPAKPRVAARQTSSRLAWDGVDMRRGGVIRTSTGTFQRRMRDGVHHEHRFESVVSGEWEPWARSSASGIAQVDGYYTLLPIEPPKAAEPRYAKSGQECVEWAIQGGTIACGRFRWMLNDPTLINGEREYQYVIGSTEWSPSRVVKLRDDGFRAGYQLIPPEY